MKKEILVSLLILFLIIAIVIIIWRKELAVRVMASIVGLISLIFLIKMGVTEWAYRNSPDYIKKIKFPNLSKTDIGTGYQQGVGMPLTREQIYTADRAFSDEFDTLKLELEQNAIDDAKLVAETRELLKK